jgi:hypothetical protein
MSQPVIIENDFVRMEVYPHIGGKVASLIDKADKFEMMFDYPVELPTRAQYDIRYDEGWHAGWDECFPAVAPGKYPSHPYEGINVPDHGELWGLPTVAVPTKDGITTVWHGLRFGYRLTRKLHLEGSSILADYTLVNLAPFEFRFVWAMHPFMSMASPVQLDVQAVRFRFSHDEVGMDHQQLFEWPNLSADLNVSDFATIPERRGWKMFSMEPIATPVKVRYPARGRSLSIEYASEENQLPAYWGIWINTGGWAGNKAFSVEPTTGRFDQLDRAVGDGSAGRVEPMGRREWSVKWTLS